jgi:hypothetical protein
MGEREWKRRRGARTLTSTGERQRGRARRSARARERACVYLLRGIKHVGQHDVGAINDHVQAQRLLLTIDLVHITAEQGSKGEDAAIGLLAVLDLGTLAVDSHWCHNWHGVPVGRRVHGLKHVLDAAICDLLSKVVDVGELHLARLALHEGLLEIRHDDGAFVSVLHDRRVHVLDDEIEPRGVEVVLLEVFGLKKVHGVLNSDGACAKKGSLPAHAGRKRARKHQRQRGLRHLESVARVARPAFRRDRRTWSGISAENDSAALEGLLDCQHDEVAFVSILDDRLFLDDDVLLLEVFGLKKVRGVLDSGGACAKKRVNLRARGQKEGAQASSTARPTKSPRISPCQAHLESHLRRKRQYCS